MTKELSELTAALGSSDATAQQAAAERLAQMGTGAQHAAVPLIEACASDNDDLLEWTHAALEGLGPPAVADLNRLTALLNHSAADVAYWAATLLGRLQGAAAPACEALIAATGASRSSEVRERAVWALGQIGPAAKAAIAALEQLSAATDPRLARLAKDATRQVQAD